MELHRACRPVEGVLARVKIRVNPKSLTGYHTMCTWLQGQRFPPHVPTPTWLGSSVMRGVDVGLDRCRVHITSQTGAT